MCPVSFLVAPTLITVESQIERQAYLSPSAFPFLLRVLEDVRRIVAVFQLPLTAALFSRNIFVEYHAFYARPQLPVFLALRQRKYIRLFKLIFVSLRSCTLLLLFISNNSSTGLPVFKPAKKVGKKLLDRFFKHYQGNINCWYSCTAVVLVT